MALAAAPTLAESLVLTSTMRVPAMAGSLSAAATRGGAPPRRSALRRSTPAAQRPAAGSAPAPGGPSHGPCLVRPEVAGPRRCPPRGRGYGPVGMDSGFDPYPPELAGCRLCPRLAEYREQVARQKRRAYRDEEYWGAPVPGFGDPEARLVIVGLAPGAHGSNRTGRM